MMIVKKIPILQGFPALETVKYLSSSKIISTFAYRKTINIYRIQKMNCQNIIRFFTILRQLDYQDILHLCIWSVQSDSKKINGCFISGWGKMKTRRFLFYRNLQVFWQMLIVRFSIMGIDLTCLFWKNVIENTKWILHLKKFYPLIYISC